MEGDFDIVLIALLLGDEVLNDDVKVHDVGMLWIDGYMLTAVLRLLRHTPHRIENYVERTVPNYLHHEFQQHFRVNRAAYETLLNIVGPRITKIGPIGRNTIPVEKQLLSVLWILATPDSYRSVSDRFNLAKSSLSVSFMRVVDALCQIANEIICWPTIQQRRVISRGFQRISWLENVIGCVDGTYIPIKAPKQDPRSYITRKCNFAMTLQAICDDKLRFIDAFMGYPGSVSDNRIFRNSDIYKPSIRHKENFFQDDEFILGDKAYPLTPWCITPYINRGNLTRAQIHFNTKHAQTRQTIERSFALLFGRYRRLKYLDMNRTDMIPSTVLAACVMHNICLHSEDQHLEQYIADGRAAVLDNDLVDQGQLHMQQDGQNRRDQLCRLLTMHRE